MAIERKSGRRFKQAKSQSRNTFNLGTFKVLLVFLVLIPIVFYFIAPEIRNSFISYQTGQIYERFHKISTAKRHYESAYKSSEQKNLKAQWKFAQMCNYLEEYNSALKATTNVIEEIKPADQALLSKFYLEQGRANEGLEDFDAAMISYSRGAKLDADNYHVLIGLGKMYRVKGDYKRSRKTLEDAVNIHKLRSPEAHYELALTYIAENNNADALDELDYALSQLPSRKLKHKAQQKKNEIIAN
ncbi:hypothetical protein J7L05_00985 [bacterium]|nr:hypothetical protein [bacterium]